MGYYGAYRRRRLRSKLAVATFFILFFGLGSVFGFYYDGDGGVDLPYVAAVEAILLYGGDAAACPAVVAALPRRADDEAADGSEAKLRTWELSYGDDGQKGKVPVFYGEIADIDGAISAMGTTLIRSAVREIPLEPASPPKTSVLIYCTHTAESFAGNKADTEGRGDILAVAHRLAETLRQEHGIGAVVSDNVHDSPDWYRSYSNSKATAESLLAEYPDADLVIDLHRDSGLKKEDTTVTLANGDAASMLLVVGSNVKLSHPDWEQNWATAKALGKCIDAVDGRLLRGIRVQKGRYNQHLSPKCVLLEVGTELNTKEEALYSAELTAKAIADYLAKQN